MGKKIIAAGHICLDITPVFPDQKAENIGDIMIPGKLIQMYIPAVRWPIRG